MSVYMEDLFEALRFTEQEWSGFYLLTKRFVLVFWFNLVLKCINLMLDSNVALKKGGWELG